MWQHSMAIKIIQVLTFAIGYLIIVPIIGCFRAWVAKQVGDTTPEDSGFLTLNPLAHIDPIGFMVLLLFRFGWGKHVFINPQHITEPHRWFKFFCATMVAMGAYLLLAVTAFVLYVLFYGRLSGFLTGQPPELAVVLLSIVYAIIFISAFLAVMDFFIDMLMAILVYLGEQSSAVAPYLYYIFLFAPIVFLFLFGEQLTILFVQGIDYVAQICMHFIGI